MPYMTWKCNLKNKKFFHNFLKKFRVEKTNSDIDKIGGTLHFDPFTQGLARHYQVDLKMQVLKYHP